MALILVVDDEALLLLDFGSFTEERNHQVVYAPNANKAYSLLQTHPIDGIVSDTRMPNGNGVELLHLVKNDSNFDAIPFLLHSADESFEGQSLYDLCSTFPGVEFHRKRPGVYDYLEKFLAQFEKP